MITFHLPSAACGAASSMSVYYIIAQGKIAFTKLSGEGQKLRIKFDVSRNIQSCGAVLGITP